MDFTLVSAYLSKIAMWFICLFVDPLIYFRSTGVNYFFFLVVAASAGVWTMAV